MKRHQAGVAAMLLLSATMPRVAEAAAVAIDPALVMPLSDVAPEVADQVMGWEPVLAHFSKDGHDLYFVAANHESRRGNKTCSLIWRAFRKFRIQAVLIEGHPYEDGREPDSRESEIVQERKSPSHVWDEGECAAFLALKRRLPVYGGEPTDKEKLKGALAKGYTSDDYLALQFLSIAGYDSRVHKWSPAKAQTVFQWVMGWEGKQSALINRSLFTYADFLKWYRQRNGVDFDPADAAILEAPPDPNAKFFQNRIAHEVDMARNRFLAGVISKSLGEYGSVLVVYGNGHLAVEWKALKSALGEPVYVGNLRAPKTAARAGAFYPAPAGSGPPVDLRP